jgi:plastocyanin
VKRLSRGLLACLLPLVVALPACGGDDSDDGPIRVVITDKGYEPRDLTVSAGDEVRFVNRSLQSSHTAKDSTPGPVDHSPQPGPTDHDGSEVARASHAGFATHALFPKEVQRVVFPVADEYEYYCALHPSMTGRIEVVE